MPISLKIYGNPEANAGFQPLVLVNNASFRVEDTNYGVGSEFSFFYTVRIEESQTVYTMVKNRVHSYGATREGALKISIGIPAKMRMASGTPLDVLRQVYSSFVSGYMTLQHVEREEYEFKKGRVDDAEFKTIVDSYQLVSVCAPQRVMLGTGFGVCVVPHEKLHLLMQDVQYREFQTYSEVAVVEEGVATGLLSALSVPRTPVYKVNSSIDGKSQERQVYDVNEILRYSTTRDELAYENVTQSFSITQLLAGEQIEGVQLDAENEVVTCTLSALPRVQAYKLVATDEDTKRLLLMNATKMQIQYGNSTKSVTMRNTESFIELSGQEILAPQNMPASLVNAAELSMMMTSFIRRGSLFEITLRKRSSVVPPPPMKSELMIVLPEVLLEREVMIRVDDVERNSVETVYNGAKALRVVVDSKKVSKKANVQVCIDGYKPVDKECKVLDATTLIRFYQNDFIRDMKRWLIVGVVSAIVILVGAGVGVAYWQGWLGPKPTPSVVQNDERVIIHVDPTSLTFKNVYNAQKGQQKTIQLKISSKDSSEITLTVKGGPFELSQTKLVVPSVKDTCIKIGVTYTKTKEVGSYSTDLLILCDKMEYKVSLSGTTEKTKEQLELEKKQEEEKLTESYKTFTEHCIGILKAENSTFENIKKAISEYEDKYNTDPDYKKFIDDRSGAYGKFPARIAITREAIEAVEKGYEEICKFVESHPEKPEMLYNTYYVALTKAADAAGKGDEGKYDDAKSYFNNHKSSITSFKAIWDLYKVYINK